MEVGDVDQKCYCGTAKCRGTLTKSRKLTEDWNDSNDEEGNGSEEEEEEEGMFHVCEEWMSSLLNIYAVVGVGGDKIFSC